MASSQRNSTTYNPDLYLNPEEQDLLINALNSNMPPLSTTNGTPAVRSSSMFGMSNLADSGLQHSPSADSPRYQEPNPQTPMSAGLHNPDFDDSPYLDNELDETRFNWDLNADLIGDLPGASEADLAAGEEEHGDKRKSPEDGDDEDGGGKRHENEDKTAKKPGRKPLTSEPTTKRKAQNRAAQRAFRERKEKHLKDLETKVEDLEKASEATNHENGVLRAQVDRLQTELKEYRRRLSLNSTPYSRGSPTSHGVNQPVSKRSWDINNSFQFDFPRFGGSEGPVKRSSSSTASSFPPMFTSNGIINEPFPINGPVPGSQVAPTPTFARANSDALFSPTTQGSANSHSINGEESAGRDLSTARSGVPGANGSSRQSSAPALAQSITSDATVASPASHASNLGLASSAATTPESVADSPTNHKSSEPLVSGVSDERNGRRGTLEDFSSTTSSIGNQPDTPALDFQGIDWLANQNGGTFDPVLFGDYRDPQENVMSNDFGTTFFNDAFPGLDLGLAAPDKPLKGAPPKKDLLQEIDIVANEDPAAKDAEKSHLLTCNSLWDRVQASSKLQNEQINMDDLCTQLKAKAKCSGSGKVISENDLEQILGPSASKVAPAEPDYLKMFK